MEYWGLEAISRRMGWRDPRTPVGAHLQEGFPMYPRRKGGHPRKVYFTNDAMITAWELAKAKLHRERLLGTIEEKQRMVRQPIR